MELKSIGQKIIDIDLIKYQFMGLIYIPQNKNILFSKYNKISKKISYISQLLLMNL